MRHASIAYLTLQMSRYQWVNGYQICGRTYVIADAGVKIHAFVTRIRGGLHAVKSADLDHWLLGISGFGGLQTTD